MAHPALLEFMEKVRAGFPAFFAHRKVLEIGSLDINGSVRGLFTACDYTGVDIAPGRGVDIVCLGQDYPGPDGSFDVVLSCEVMEHNPHWAATMANMIRLTRPGGLVIMTCATLGRPEHGTARSFPGSSPLTVEQGWNYYRNLTARDLLAAVDLKALRDFFCVTNWASYDLYFVALKAGEPEADARPKLEALAALASVYRRTYWTSWKCLRRSLRQHLKLAFQSGARG